MGIKVSVIVPVYQTEQYLEKCLDSLIKQTLKEIEIVVVNDGSPDNVWNVIEKSAKVAKEGNFDYFTTTLTISPLKNADWLNEIGRSEGEKEGILFLPSDFKKKDGYKRSIQLSNEFGLYRQDFCGCGFSKAEMEERRTLQGEKA